MGGLRGAPWVGSPKFSGGVAKNDPKNGGLIGDLCTFSKKTGPDWIWTPKILGTAYLASPGLQFSGFLEVCTFGGSPWWIATQTGSGPPLRGVPGGVPGGGPDPPFGGQKWASKKGGSGGVKNGASGPLQTALREAIGSQNWSKWSSEACLKVGNRFCSVLITGLGQK